MRVAARAVLAVFVICRVAAAQVLPDIETLGKKKQTTVFVSIPTEPGLVYLSSIEPDIVKRYGAFPLVDDLSVQLDARTRVGGQCSLSVHPQEHNGYSAVKFTLDKDFDGIVGVYGFVTEEPREGSSLRFMIQSEKQVLWQSEPVTRDQPSGRFAVRIKGKQNLELWVKLKGFYERTDAGWIEPVLIPPEFELSERVADLREQASSLEVKDAPSFRQRSLLLSGVAEVRGDKKAMSAIQQAEKVALQRLKRK